MGRKPIVSKQRLLGAIQQWIVERGMPPTLDELRRVLRVGSTRTILRHLQVLEGAGDIERWPGARGIRLRRAPAVGVETRAVPVVGEAPAGALMTADENIEGYVRLPQTFLPAAAKFFLLRVRGDSMNRAVVDGVRIENGDLVLVKQQTTAESGQIVVALIDGGATIKQLQRGPGYWTLKPHSMNLDHQPIVVESEFRVLGAVQRVLKKGSDILKLVEE